MGEELIDINKTTQKTKGLTSLINTYDHLDDTTKTINLFKPYKIDDINKLYLDFERDIAPKHYDSGKFDLTDRKINKDLLGSFNAKFTDLTREIKNTPILQNIDLDFSNPSLTNQLKQKLETVKNDIDKLKVIIQKLNNASVLVVDIRTDVAFVAHPCLNDKHKLKQLEDSRQQLQMEYKPFESYESL